MRIKITTLPTKIEAELEPREIKLLLYMSFLAGKGTKSSDEFDSFKRLLNKAIDELT